MIDFTPSEEQQALIDVIRRFVREEIIPLEADLDPDAAELKPRDFTRLRQKVRDLGLYGMDIPEEFGGPGLDVTTRALLAMEMTQHRGGLYTACYGVFGGAGLAQLYEATDDQKERYLYPTLRGEKRGFFGLSEPSGGSDPARAIRTKAVKDDDEWVINGSKLWISGADDADYGILFTRTGEGREGITAFIIDTDTPGFQVRRVVHTLRSAHYATELSLDDVRVSDAQRLGPVGQGFALANDRLSAQRIPYAAQCIGVAEMAHRMAIDYAQLRETFGQRLAARQGIQWMLVDNEIDLRSARLLVLAAAAKADRGEPFRTDAAVAKIVATEAAGRVVDRAIQIHGGLGVSKELPLERWYRELRIRRIGEGPTEVQKMIVARDLLGKIAG
ncbi:cyclohexanecarboxyl-CoA dehydrogenase [Sphingomonas sp. CL5.1]|uniref:acyl-CoA dehydrogenase family protein n=1 Tax=Sphingomonas sp. CL5.1 TaxID=2653203 RepID=UPI0015837AA7|nr:acyl-CoA dehydrogenase family protein [Sphingomonas sp. CL5.1]QKR99296.1 cyclohexanecarboxyl-CoA dehydrogenase [Sphingomonas sp. CL5.1]